MAKSSGNLSIPILGKDQVGKITGCSAPIGTARRRSLELKRRESGGVNQASVPVLSRERSTGFHDPVLSRSFFLCDEPRTVAVRRLLAGRIVFAISRRISPCRR